VFVSPTWLICPHNYLYLDFKNINNSLSLHIHSYRLSIEVSLPVTENFTAGSIHLSGLACNPRVKLLYIVDDAQEKWDAIKQYWKLDDTLFLCSKGADKVFHDPRYEYSSYHCKGP
jgi:hypothetical protein